MPAAGCFSPPLPLRVFRCTHEPPPPVAFFVVERLPVGFLAQLRIQGLARSRCSLKTCSEHDGRLGGIFRGSHLHETSHSSRRRKAPTCPWLRETEEQATARSGSGLLREESRHPPSHSGSRDDREGERTFRSPGSDAAPDGAGHAIHPPGRGSPPARPAPPSKEKPQKPGVNTFHGPSLPEGSVSLRVR